MNDHNYTKKIKDIIISYKKCSVPGCHSRKSNTILLHSIPKNLKLRESWIHRCRIGIKLTKSVVVCSKHFVAADYKNGKPCE